MDISANWLSNEVYERKLLVVWKFEKPDFPYLPRVDDKFKEYFKLRKYLFDQKDLD